MRLGMFVHSTLTAALAGAIVSLAQPSPEAAVPARSFPDSAALLPIDESFQIGRLDNGLTYYVRHCAAPDNRLEVRLVVRAGSLMEDDDQLGLAHFLEHMVFNGSTHFPARSVMHEVESLGGQTGADLNALTSYDRTVYRLKIPADSDSTIEKALLVLADFAHGATLDSAEIEKERGIVLEERRLHDDPDARIADQHLAVMYPGTRRPQRLPIGTIESIRQFRPGALRRFYREWYTPDRMAVVAIGDVSPSTMAELIRKHFGPIPASAVRHEPLPVIAHRPETEISIASDPKATFSRIRIVMRRRSGPLRTAGDYCDGMRDALACRVLKDHLVYQDTLYSYRNAINSFSSRSDVLDDSTRADIIDAYIRDGSAMPCLKAILTGLQRLAQHGVDSAEVAPSISKMRREAETAEIEGRNRDSDDLVAAAVDHFLGGTPLLSPEDRKSLANRCLDKLTAAELSTACRRFVQEPDRAILLSLVARDTIKIPTEAEVGRMIRDIESEQVAEGENKLPRSDFDVSKPRAGRILSEKALPEIGVTVLSLSNGVQVWLKPTDFKSDEILVQAFSGKGALLFPKESYLSALHCERFVALGDAGGFADSRVRGELEATSVSGKVYVDDDECGLSCRTAPADLEKAFQAIYLTYRKLPRRSEYLSDVDYYRRWREALETDLTNDAANIFEDQIREAVRSGHYSGKPRDHKLISGMTLNASIDAYYRLFSHPADFTFVVAGAFQLDEIKPLIEQYVASLIPFASSSLPAFPLLQFPGKTIHRMVAAGQAPRGRLTLVFPGPPALESAKVDESRWFAARFLRGLMWDRLRAELGDIYTVNVSSSKLPGPGAMATTRIETECAPDKVAEVEAEVLAIIGKTQSGRIEAERFDRARKTLTADLEENEISNSAWANMLRTMVRAGGDPVEWSARKERLLAFTPEDLQATVQQFCPLDHFVSVTMVPEKKSRAGQ